MFLFKNTKSIVKRIGMNMVVYGFAGIFVFILLEAFLPATIRNYVYILMVISFFATIIGGIISVALFIYELTPYAIRRKIESETHINNQNIIYSYGIKQPGSLFETVELKNENGSYYYVTLSMVDKWHCGGEKLPVPKSFVTHGQVDIEGLLEYIAKNHPYMGSMKHSKKLEADTDNSKSAVTPITDSQKSRCAIENNNHNEEVVPVLPSRCKYLCSISKDNGSIEKIVDYRLKRKFEVGYDSYSILLDSEEGTMFFVHNTLEHIGAAYDSQVRYATAVSFDNVKFLLLYELDYYKLLVERWEKENDIDRANSCKEHLQKIEKIINTNTSDLKELADL